MPRSLQAGACAAREVELNMIATRSIETMKETNPYLAKFEELNAPTAGRHPSWLFPLRKAGLARFAELGFPTLKDEDWRFTNVAPIAKLPFKPVFGASRNGLGREDIAKFTFGILSANRVVFVNGHYVAELSAPAPMAAGVRVQ